MMLTAIFTGLSLVLGVIALAGAVEECKVKPSGEPPYAGLSLAGAALVCAFLAGRWSL